MNRGRNILRKAAVATLSSSMILAGGSNVFAAGSYQETARASLDSLVSSTAGVVDEYAQNMTRSLNGSTGKLTLTVEDTGKAIIGSLLGQQDMTWLQNLSMDMNVSIKNGTEAIDSTLLLNGQQLCDLNIYQDLSELTQYIQIPEISDAYLAVKPADGADNTTQEFMKSYMDAFSDLSSVVPDSETIKTLLDRYGNLVIDNMEEGTSVTETVSVEGIGEDATVYEGLITEASARSMLEAVLTTAKDDKEMKGLFDLWADAGSSEEDQYAKYQSGIDELLTGLKSSDADDSESTENFSEKLWVNSEDKIVGREIGVTDGTDYEPLFALKTPSQDGKTALLLEVGAGDSHLTLTGSGASSDGLWSGDYIFAADGTETLDIKVENLELKPEKAGYYNGTFTVSFPESASADGEDDSAANPLNGFSAVVKFSSDAASETCNTDLSLITSGVSLGTLSIAGGYGEGVEIPDLKNLGTVYAANDDKEMSEYAENADWSVLAENMKKAGVPEELADGLQQMLESAAEETTAETQADTAEQSDETSTEATEPAA